MTIVPSIYHPFSNNLLVPGMHNILCLYGVCGLLGITDIMQIVTMDIDAMKRESRVL